MNTSRASTPLFMALSARVNVVCYFCLLFDVRFYHSQNALHVAMPRAFVRGGSELAGTYASRPVPDLLPLGHRLQIMVID
jgi:hypothetical protein